jgi:hypothetical protein
MDLEKMGVPTVTVVSEPFESLFKRNVASRKFPELPLVVLPHKIDTRPDDEVREVATERSPEVLGKLLAAIQAATAR